MDALLLSFGVVFVAELGDKSQLMTLAFAARYPTLPVVLGITTASAAVMGVSVLVGAAALFLVFGVVLVVDGLPG